MASFEGYNEVDVVQELFIYLSAWMDESCCSKGVEDGWQVTLDF